MVFLVIRLLLCLYFLLFLFLFFIRLVTVVSFLILVCLSFFVYLGEKVIDLVLSLLVVITSWRSHTFFLFLT